MLAQCSVDNFESAFRKFLAHLFVGSYEIVYLLTFLDVPTLQPFAPVVEFLGRFE